MPGEKPECCLEKEGRGSQKLTQASSASWHGWPIRNISRARDLGIRLRGGLGERLQRKPAHVEMNKQGILRLWELGKMNEKSPQSEGAGKHQRSTGVDTVSPPLILGGECSLDT